MFPSDINLVPITEEQRKKATALDVFKRLSSRGELGDPYQFNGKPISAVSGKCLKLDMDKEEDRSTYSDLVARAVVNPDDIVILWEERIKTDTGSLIIYLCYVSTLKTASSFIK